MYLPKRSENTRPCKNRYTNVHGSRFIKSTGKEPKCLSTNKQINSTQRSIIQP